MMGSEHEVNAMGSAFLLAAANDRSAGMLAEQVLGFLQNLPEGMVIRRFEDGLEAAVTDWGGLLGILIEGTDDEVTATLAAESISAGCAAAYELDRFSVVGPGIEAVLHARLTALALRETER